MPRRADLASVELVEGDDVPPAELHATVAAAPRRRRWWLLLAAPVMILGLVVGAQQVIDGRERAADARIAALPGAIAQVGDHLGTVWTTDPGTSPLASGPVADGALHGLLVGPDGSLTYSTVDVDTGTQVWSATLRGPDPALTDPTNRTTTDCQAAADDRAVCFVTDGYRNFSDTGDASDGRPATQAHAVVLDLADGSVLADHPVAPAGSLAVLPGLVATAVVDDQEHLVVVATDPMTGDELWRYRDPDPVRGAADDSAADIAGAGGVVVLFNRPGGPLVLTPTGLPLDADGEGGSWQPTLDGGLAWALPDPAGGDQKESVLRGGEHPLDVTGDLLDSVVDDGSIPGLALSSGRKTYAWDARTGRKLWEADVAAAQNAGGQTLVLQGRVYLTTADAVVALDGRDGSLVWSTPRSPSTTGGGLLTDGLHVLLVQSPLDSSGTGDLLVMDRRNGTALRRVPLPVGVAYAWVAGHRLITDDGTAVRGIG
ncbi:outer membrane protein assembly factor BamB family protein [Cellulomonas sp. P5_C6]